MLGCNKGKEVLTSKTIPFARRIVTAPLLLTSNCPITPSNLVGIVASFNSSWRTPNTEGAGVEDAVDESAWGGLESRANDTRFVELVAGGCIAASAPLGIKVGKRWGNWKK